MADETHATGTTEDPTGTTTTVADGSGDPAAGGSSEELRAQLEEERRKNAQLLSEKSRVEEERRRIESERAGAATPSPSGAPDEGTQLAAVIRHRAYVEGNPEALATIELARLQQESNRQQQEEFKRQRDEADLSRIPPEDVAEVRAAYAEGRGGFASVPLCYDAILGKRFRTSQQKREDERRRAEDAAARRANDVVDTTAVGVGASEIAKRTYEWDEYNNALRTLPREKALELKSKADRKLIVVKPPA